MSPSPTRRSARGGFSLIEMMIASAVIVLAAMVGLAYVARGTQSADWTRDRIFANEKALSILGELRGYVEGSDGEVAADLDKFDDGTGTDATLTIATENDNPDKAVKPDHPVSGNVMNRGVWRWWRQISVRPDQDNATRDRRLCSVRIYRRLPDEPSPGTLMAHVSGVVQSVVDAFPSSQVYDLYVVAIENCPGWWVPPDGLRPFLEGAVADLETKNPGLEFRIHYITKLGYGRDEEYVPYTNETRMTTDATPWTYVYPGATPDPDPTDDIDPEDDRYYDGARIAARMNLDGESVPTFVNDYALPEPFVDADKDGVYDDGEDFTDVNGNDVYDPGNLVPYALADMHNHCMRAPDEEAKFQARVAAHLETDDAPTLRILLDRMIANPTQYHNALILNMHGELLPMPPARNYSDAAKDPELRPGWRVIAHPERLRHIRVQGNDAQSQAPRFRVYAYKSEFTNAEKLMTQEEPFTDTNKNGVFDAGETYQDWNGNGVRDTDVPITVCLNDVDLSANPNGATNPSLLLQALPGGIDSNGDGTVEDYPTAWTAPQRLPESFTDTNGDGIRQVAEQYFDLNGNGVKDAFETYQDFDGDGKLTVASEPLVDNDGDNRLDLAKPEEPFTDTNGNGKYDVAEAYWDKDGNGVWTPPTNPASPWVPWDPTNYGKSGPTTTYIKSYGEPFLDANGDKKYTAAETFVDSNKNGRWDGGFRRGQMWYDLSYDATGKRTVVKLHGTPLEAPQTGTKRGLKSDFRLYEMDYVPCATPALATSTVPFERDLSVVGDFPKNTARWTIEIPLAQIRKSFETSPGAGNGDATDRLLRVSTRLGSDLTTGTMWPTRNKPTNRSATYTYFYADPSGVPFSERYQFQGDPRNCPYADLRGNGLSFPNGYNAWWDDFDAKDWAGFTQSWLHERWMGRSSLDVPRYMQWLRTALTKSEAVFTSMTGFSAYYLSLGGDIGYDKENAAQSIAMDGTPFGLNGVVNENTFMDLGTTSIVGCIKYVRSCNGSDHGLRTDGYWWSKPWLGELCQDAAYAGQWKTWGNLRAAVGNVPLTYKLITQEKVSNEHLTMGTDLKDSRGELGSSGCIALYMCGTGGQTFHHKEASTTGMPVKDGLQIGSNYGFPLPTFVTTKHPFNPKWGTDGTEPPEFALTADFPHATATMGAVYIAKSTTAQEMGSGVVRLVENSGAKAARMVVTSVMPDTEDGAPYLSRLQVVTLLHSLFAEGVTGTPNRMTQLPRVEILSPTSATQIKKPATVTVKWKTSWKRWDDKKYTDAYADTFAEDVANVAYVLLYSVDNGETWLNVLTDKAETPGVMPLKNGLPDVTRILSDVNPGDETYVWSTPATKIGEGSTLVRLEAYRRNEPLHFAYHVAKMYVDR